MKFLKHVRESQPTRAMIRGFFGDRYLGRNLVSAVKRCLSVRALGGRDEPPCTWLTCTGKGAMEVNYEYLKQLKFGTRESIASCAYSYRGDIGYGEHRMTIESGMWLRLTRNLDKARGFCNGAMGQVIDVLEKSHDSVVFTMRLTSGNMVLVHPIRLGDDCFLPCVYGYAMTTRKAQGSTLDFAVLYFDLFRPASPGYAYVGASRVRNHEGLYYFGKIRRSDWQAVGVTPIQPDRGVDSEDTGISDKVSSMSDTESEESRSYTCLLNTSPSPRAGLLYRMPYYA